MITKRVCALVATAITICSTDPATGDVGILDAGGGNMYVQDFPGESTVIGTFGNVLFTSSPIGSALPSHCSFVGTSTVNGVPVDLTQCTSATSWYIVGLDQLDIIWTISPGFGIVAEGGDDVDIIRLDSAGTALGNKGNDVIHGSSDGDTIQGNAGDDEIFGHEGMDTLNGGKGADIIHAIDGEQDTVNCGADSGAADTVFIDEFLDDLVNCGPADTVLFSE